MRSGSPSRLSTSSRSQSIFRLWTNDRIVGAVVIEEAVRQLRQLAGCDQRRGGLDRAPFDRGEQLPRHRPVGRHDGVRQLERRHHDVERRQVGHVLVGDRHRDGAEVGGDLLLRSRQCRPFAPERIARPEVPLLPGHEGAAPQRAVGDDGGRHEQVPARVRTRRPRQAPARPKAPGDLQQTRGRACRSGP